MAESVPLVASSFLLVASSFLLVASSFLLLASSFLLTALSFPLVFSSNAATFSVITQKADFTDNFSFETSFWHPEYHLAGIRIWRRMDSVSSC